MGKFLILTEWGFILKANRVQYGCGVGVTPAQYLGRELTWQEARSLRRHGFVVLA